MKTSQIINESEASVEAKGLWYQIQNTLELLQDELYDLTRDKKNGQIARQILSALDANDLNSVHQLIRRLQ